MKTRAGESIQAIRQRYRREWLLIDVQKLDQATTTPTYGRLLAHSRDREAIYDRLLQTRVRLPLVTYSEDTPPKGYAVAFYIKPPLHVNTDEVVLYSQRQPL